MLPFFRFTLEAALDEATPQYLFASVEYRDLAGRYRPLRVVERALNCSVARARNPRTRLGTAVPDLHRAVHNCWRLVEGDPAAISDNHTVFMEIVLAPKDHCVRGRFDTGNVKGPAAPYPEAVPLSDRVKGYAFVLAELPAAGIDDIPFLARPGYLSFKNFP